MANTLLRGGVWFGLVMIEGRWYVVVVLRVLVVGQRFVWLLEERRIVGVVKRLPSASRYFLVRLLQADIREEVLRKMPAVRQTILVGVLERLVVSRLKLLVLRRSLVLLLGLKLNLVNFSSSNYYSLCRLFLFDLLPVKVKDSWFLLLYFFDPCKWVEAPLHLSPLTLDPFLSFTASFCQGSLWFWTELSYCSLVISVNLRFKVLNNVECERCVCADASVLALGLHQLSIRVCALVTSQSRAGALSLHVLPQQVAGLVLIDFSQQPVLARLDHRLPLPGSARRLCAEVVAESEQVCVGADHVFRVRRREVLVLQRANAAGIQASVFEVEVILWLATGSESGETLRDVERREVA